MDGIHYAPGTAVMVQTDSTDEWHVGIVTSATNPRYGWTPAEVKTRPDCSMQSTWTDDQIRAAYPPDLATLPDWARAWLDQQLLDRNDPQVPIKTRPVLIALHGAGIHRLSDLKAATDSQLLALKGVGRKAVLQLREWQQSKEAATAGEVAE